MAGAGYNFKEIIGVLTPKVNMTQPDDEPQWIIDLLKKYGENTPATLSDAHIGDIAASIGAAFAIKRQPKEAPSPSHPVSKREVVWRGDVRRGFARLSSAEQLAVTQAISDLQNPQNEDNLALEYCDVFNEIVVGRYKIFYIIYGTRIEITGLKKVR